jgi:hypothetical protein
MSIEAVLNKIIERNQLIGTLALESVQCYNDHYDMAALACLFILVEQTIKFRLNVIEGNYHRLLKLAKEEKAITDDDFILLNFLRELRNKMFHENHYAWSFEVRGIQHFFSEDNTKRLLFSEYAEPCFQIVIRLLEES